MSAIPPQKLYRFVLHKFQLHGRKIDLIENQHHFGKPLIFICGLVRRCEGNDLLRHTVVHQREILRSKPRKWLALAIRCSDVEMDQALRRCVRLHLDRLRRHRGLDWNLRSFKLTISTGHTNDGQKAKEETRQNSSLRSQSLTSLGLTPSANDPEYLGIMEIELWRIGIEPNAPSRRRHCIGICPIGWDFGRLTCPLLRGTILRIA